MIIPCKPHFRLKPVRLQLRADMTIAAGILCSDGIIVCADTEHTGEVSKFQASKIIPLDEHTLLTGAGTTAFIRMAADKLRDELKGARPQSPSDARQIVETVVKQVHSEHIFPGWNGSDSYRPQIQLIVGARCENGELALIRAADSAVYLGHEFEITGTGEPIFDYWCRYFYRDRLTTAGMATLVMFIMKEVKKVHPYCGGTSQIFHLPKTQVERPFSRFFDDDHLLAGFPDNIVRILSACFFEDTSTEWIEAKLHEFVTAVRAIHQQENLTRKYLSSDVLIRDISKPSEPQT